MTGVEIPVRLLFSDIGGLTEVSERIRPAASAGFWMASLDSTPTRLLIMTGSSRGNCPAFFSGASGRW
jgi:hypothetical protein